MEKALIRAQAPAEPPPQGQERALRLLLDEARRIALQSRLIALNVAMEAAAGEMDGVGASAGRTAEEMQRAAGAVERLLEQIRAAGTLSQRL